MVNVKVKIDGVEIEVPENTTVLEAAKKLNKLIPTFCYHPKLPIFGGCRICLVYEKKWKTTIIACGTKVYDGMEIETENEQVLKDRKFILEMLFTRHPLDCPICDKAGECDLQNWGTYYGPQINYTPFTPFDKVRPEEDWQSDYFEFISNRCVLCLKCVSVCKNVNGADALFQEERGFETLISPDKKPMDTESNCEFCGLCVDICPVGAIIFKPFKFKARPWLLKETISTCGMCSLQCPVAINHDSNNILRIRSTADLEICAGAYLGYDMTGKNRLNGGMIKGEYVAIDEAISKTVEIINDNPLETAIIASPYSGNNSLRVIRDIVKKTGVYLSSTTTVTLLPVLDGFKEQTGENYNIPDEEKIINAEKIVIIGNDIVNTNPVMSYYFHKVYFEGREIGKDKEIFYIGEKAERIKKYLPKIKEIPNEDLINSLKEIESFTGKINENTAIIYSTSSLKGEKAFNIGKFLGDIYKKYNASVFIIPVERNAFGLLNILRKQQYLPDILKKMKDKKIKNLVLVGEDIVEHFDEDDLKIAFSSLENIITITPFEDGLALSSHIAIGSSLWTEEDEETEGFRKIKKSKSAVKKIQEKEILSQILDKLLYTPIAVREEQEDIRYYDYQFFITPFIELWDFGYFSKRSDNLMNMKLKNALKERILEG